MSGLLSVRDLTLTFTTDEGPVTAVDSISFDLAPGEVLGLVGESGSGKSVTAKALMRLNAGNARYGEGSRMLLNADGQEIDILRLKGAKELRQVRGDKISMIFQEPLTSLNLFPNRTKRLRHAANHDFTFLFVSSQASGKIGITPQLLTASAHHEQHMPASHPDICSDSSQEHGTDDRVG